MPGAWFLDLGSAADAGPGEVGVVAIATVSAVTLEPAAGLEGAAGELVCGGARMVVLDASDIACRTAAAGLVTHDIKQEANYKTDDLHHLSRNQLSAACC